MKRIKRKLKGFTLIEFIVSITIMALMMLISTDVIIRMTREAEKSDIRAIVNRNVNYAMETMKKSITEANGSIDNCKTNSGAIILYCIQTNIKFSNVNKSKAFYFDSNKLYLWERNDNNDSCWSAGDTKSESCNLIGNEVSVKSFNFTISKGFVEIDLEVYDSNEIVYKSSEPLNIVTGVVVKNYS